MVFVLFNTSFPPYKIPFCSYSDDDFVRLVYWVKVSKTLPLSLDFDCDINHDSLYQYRTSTTKLLRIRYDNDKAAELPIFNISHNPTKKLVMYILAQCLIITYCLYFSTPQLGLFVSFLLFILYLAIFVDIQINRPLLRYINKREILTNLKKTKRFNK